VLQVGDQHLAGRVQERTGKQVDAERGVGGEHDLFGVPRLEVVADAFPPLPDALLELAAAAGVVAQGAAGRQRVVLAHRVGHLHRRGGEAGVVQVHAAGGEAPALQAGKTPRWYGKKGFGGDWHGHFRGSEAARKEWGAARYERCQRAGDSIIMA
jgi:hypothetical protein